MIFSVRTDFSQKLGRDDLGNSANLVAAEANGGIFLNSGGFGKLYFYLIRPPLAENNRKVTEFEYHPEQGSQSRKDKDTYNKVASFLYFFIIAHSRFPFNYPRPCWKKSSRISLRGYPLAFSFFINLIFSTAFSS